MSCSCFRWWGVVSLMKVVLAQLLLFVQQFNISLRAITIPIYIFFNVLSQCSKHAFSQNKECIYMHYSYIFNFFLTVNSEFLHQTIFCLPTSLKEIKSHWSWTNLRSCHHLHLIVSALLLEAGSINEWDGWCRDRQRQYLHLWLVFNVRAQSHAPFPCGEVNSFVTYILHH